MVLCVSLGKEWAEEEVLVFQALIHPLVDAVILTTHQSMALLREEQRLLLTQVLEVREVLVELTRLIDIWCDLLLVQDLILLERLISIHYDSLLVKQSLIALTHVVCDWLGERESLLLRKLLFVWIWLTEFWGDLIIEFKG